MHWIIQSNFIEPKDVSALSTALTRMDVPYSLVNIIPYVHEIMETIDIENPVFVYGSTGFNKVAKKHGWAPGYIDENLDVSIYTPEYGSLMLNSDINITSYRNAENLPSKFFIRPLDDKKSFTGKVMTLEEFKEQRLLLSKLLKSDPTTYTLDTPISISSVKTIYAEYRFYIVDDKVVTGSIYKRGSQVYYSSEIEPEIYTFVQDSVKHWSPNRAFVMDVALTESGLKIIELNNINSSGFYAIDLYKWIDAIQSLTPSPQSCLEP